MLYSLGRYGGLILTTAEYDTLEKMPLKDIIRFFEMVDALLYPVSRDGYCVFHQVDECDKTAASQSHGAILALHSDVLLWRRCPRPLTTVRGSRR